MIFNANLILLLKHLDAIYPIDENDLSTIRKSRLFRSAISLAIDPPNEYPCIPNLYILKCSLK